MYRKLKIYLMMAFFLLGLTSLSVAAPVASNKDKRTVNPLTGTSNSPEARAQELQCLELKKQGLADKDCKPITPSKPIVREEPANGEIAPNPPVQVELPPMAAPERGRESWQCPANYHCECHGSGFRVECHLNQAGSNGPQSCKDLNNPPGTCSGAVWGY